MIELSYPYEEGSTYEITKVDPGGTAQIVEIGPSPDSEWAEHEPLAVLFARTSPLEAWEAEPLLLGGPCLMLVKPPVDGGEPRLFRVEVSAVGVKEWTVQLDKAGAALVRTGDRCSLIRPLAFTGQEFRFLGDNRRDIREFGRSEPTLTQDELRAFPQVIPLVPARKEQPRVPESLQQARTLANLSAIGRAIKRFSDVTIQAAGLPRRSRRQALA